jgi:hypothetical protein
MSKDPMHLALNALSMLHTFRPEMCAGGAGMVRGGYWIKLEEASDAIRLAFASQPLTEPFTQAQMRRLYDNSPEFHCDVTSRYGFYRIVALAERAHSITAAPTTGEEV